MEEQHHQGSGDQQGNDKVSKCCIVWKDYIDKSGRNQ